MRKKILLVSNSNFFSVLSRLYLKDDYDCQLFHVRCENESLTKEEHFIWQLREMNKEALVQKGILNSKHEFYFSDKLCERFDSQISLFKPDMVIVELKSMDQAEFQMIHYLTENYDFPVTVYNDFVTDSSVFSKLDSLRIKGCVWAMDKSLFLDTVKFNLNLSNT
jgi:hypothetical protein